MPTIEHRGAKIYYEEYGKGFPILTFAPAGVKSTIAVWSQPSAPINPITEFSGNHRVIVMDQRNAGGKSWAPINAKDGWHSFTQDHIAVLDHLKIDRCHLYGQCIGGSFIMSLLEAQPQRVASAVLAQPIGRGSVEAGPRRALRRMGEGPHRSSGGNRRSARRVLSEPLRAGISLQRGSRIREELQNAVPRARGQRRSASIPDLGRNSEAAAQCRIHSRVEGRRGTGSGESARE